MAKARMIHNKISLSLQVNELSDKAALLFTWAISHADDDGRMIGDAKTMHARIVPLRKWSVSLLEKLLEEITNKGLWQRWKQNNLWYIEFPTWKRYQQIRNDRYSSSLLPAFSTKNGDFGIQNDNQPTTQSNIVKSNPIEFSKGEDSEVVTPSQISYKEGEEDYVTQGVVNPRNFKPANKKEAAALIAWKKLESRNPMAFTTTYLKACRKGLPEWKFYDFSSEIDQDKTINNKGAVFNAKVDEYFNSKQNAV
ncbi:hypothetical protein A2274_00260 [candidate division WWE3 bacterium RIFOXYA12_FULL_43_11]|uniref:Uncharacterized protein n=2 Tax=Katanobacteria TaxID=422282 RepID=A0A0G0VQQ5_UNCKA|nr:MAG: hypothetical protein UR43_C0017G0008 [candidate division TM6 bacterium GW2011_GWF2_33_332]KKS03219.1 MAG: hypothetical protein UU55_C0004G0008 [candidate division WWE3 bacterium GW2011_GWC2_41_23]OGC65533.1 MAG: hypothetical protein A2274_00260 [candidate division WWE3 bacterium RIFOXYA12_FULL_43_11]HBY09774.1 hypothetical protein [candidate division WWE3 bacterium]HLD90705.1 hypothetical protein [Patescibacteria group bacterium]